MATDDLKTRRIFMRNAGLFAVTVAVPPMFLGCASKGASEEDSGGSAQNKEWEDAAKKLEGTSVLSEKDPGTKWAGKEKGHVPQVSFQDGQVTLVTQHGMSEEHWITTHYLRDQNGIVIGYHEYQPTDPKAEHSFSLPPGTTEIIAFSHCNLHDHWRGGNAKVS
jgi:desulfoferrodoxin (superoxide reductase-like protein)